MLRKFLLLIPAAFLGYSAHAQLEKVIHQTFDPADLTNITINLEEEYELQSWSGNQILTETFIQLYDASPEILKFFIEEKHRYEITMITEGEGMTLESTDQERNPIQYHGTECYEFVRTKVFVPESYERAGDNQLRRID
ncbi:MAG: hypothetical protein KDC34_07395 [Saprospiraceae bacterium]|nr:hypothetical protein [Saprospiraceae bacterium]